MGEIIYGAVGVLGTLALLGLGAALGWWSRGRWQQRQHHRAAGQREWQRQREDERAFSLLMGYNADLAYGVTTAGDMLPERNDEEREEV